MDPSPSIPTPPPLPVIPAAPPIAPPFVPGSHPQPVFSREFPCIHCAYDLRSIHLADRCPECGKPAADALNSLAGGRVADIASVRRGLLFLVVSGLVIPLLAMLIVFIAIASAGPSSGEPVGIAYFVGFLILGCGPICGAIGAGLATTPIRRVDLPTTFSALAPPPSPDLPIAWRLALGAHCLFSILAGLMMIVVTNSNHHVEEPLIFTTAVLVGLAILSWDLRNIILCRAIAAFCERANLSGSRRIFQILAVFAICFGIGHALVGLFALLAYFNFETFGRLFSGASSGPNAVIMTIYGIVSITASIVQFATLCWMILWPIMLLITRHRLARPLALATASRGDFLAMPTNPDAEFITIERDTDSDVTVPGATVQRATSSPGASSDKP